MKKRSRRQGIAAKAAAAAVQAVEDNDDDTEAQDLGPLFSFDGAARDRHEKTQVFRMEPIDEGHIGDIPPDSTIGDIRARWGGGRFRVVALDANNKYIERTSNIRIGGDPIFENEVAKKRYQRWLTQTFGKDDAPGAPQTDPEDAREARHQRELARIRAEAEANLAKARADAEAREAAEERRRQRDREEREAAENRRRAEDRAEREAAREERRLEREERLEADERRWKAEMEERRAERESKGDPLAQLAVMAQIFGGLQNNGPDDPVTAIANRLPEILQEARATGEAMTGGKDKKKKKRNAQAREDQVQLQGDIGLAAHKAIKRLEAMGKDPEEVLGAVFQRIAGAKAAPERKQLRAKETKGATRIDPKPQKKPASATAKNNVVPLKPGTPKKKKGTPAT